MDPAGSTDEARAPASPSPGRGLILVACGFAAVLLAMLTVRDYYYLGERGFVRTGAFAISGDEPHYLIVLNSMLFDGDLDLRADYPRVRRGGLEAGIQFRGVNLDHHTMVVDPVEGRSGFWQELYTWNAEPCPPSEPDCMGFRLSPRGFPPSAQMREASSHPLMFPALLAAMIAPRAPTAAEVERFASDSIILLAWLGLLLTYFLARGLGFERRDALLTAGLLLASPWLPYSRSYFSEIGIGFALVLGLFAMHKEKPALAALAIVVATGSIKLPFVAFGLAWAFERAWARRYREAAILAGMVTAGTVGIILFSIWYGGTWLIPPATPGMANTNLIAGLGTTILGDTRGILRFAPWAAAVALTVRWAIRPAVLSLPATHLLRQILLPLGPYILLVATMGPGFGANCYGPRYYVCVMPFLAVAAGLAWRSGSRTVRIGIGVLGLVALTISLPGWIQYGLLWDKPATMAWQAFSLPPPQ